MRAGGQQRAHELVVVILRAVEHQVLEQVREAAAARALVLAADVVPDIHRYDRGLVVLVDYQGQAVRKGVFLVRDVDVGERGFSGRGSRRAHVRENQQCREDDLKASMPRLLTV